MTNAERVCSGSALFSSALLMHSRINIILLPRNTPSSTRGLFRRGSLGALAVKNDGHLLERVSSGLGVGEEGREAEEQEHDDEDEIVPAQKPCVSGVVVGDRVFANDTHFQPILSSAIGLTKVLKKMATTAESHVTVTPRERRWYGQISHG